MNLEWTDEDDADVERWHVDKWNAEAVARMQAMTSQRQSEDK